MTNVIVDLNPNALGIVPGHSRRDGQASTSAHTKRVAFPPAKHPCQEPSRQSRAGRVLRHDEFEACDRVDEAFRSSSVSSLFSALHEAGKSTLFEKTMAAALALGAAISIGASFMQADELLAGLPSFARLVEMILS